MGVFYEPPLEERILTSGAGIPRGSLKAKEVVLVADDREKRLNWKVGVVQKLIIGRNGRCRTAAVQVKSGLLRRPIRKLHKLEICAETDNLPRYLSVYGIEHL